MKNYVKIKMCFVLPLDYMRVLVVILSFDSYTRRDYYRQGRRISHLHESINISMNGDEYMG